jgi:hypothetical protein
MLEFEDIALRSDKKETLEREPEIINFAVPKSARRA